MHTTLAHQPRATRPTHSRLHRLLPVWLAGLLLAGLMLAAAPALAAARTLYVSSSASSDPTCAMASQTNPFASIAGALDCAADGSKIVIGTGTFAGRFTITHSVTLQGSGSGTVISNPGAPVESLTEVTVASGKSVTLKDLTVDGQQQQSDVAAGSGSLTIVDSTITGGVGYPVADVGVTATSGVAKLTILDSTISNGIGLSSTAGGVNIDSAAAGASSVTTIVNSTIAGNQGGDGGGIGQSNHGSLTVRDSTIAGNSANFGGGLYDANGVPSPVSLTNTILAGNAATQGSDCLVPIGASVTDGSHNILGVNDGYCQGINDGSNGDQAGTASSPINPELGALQDNGGATPTMALLPGSPAINAGDPAECQATPVANRDQRGLTRNAQTRLACDVGAYDTAGKPLQTLYVSHKAASDPACSAASKTNPFATITGALSCASGGTLISVGPGTFPAGLTAPGNVVVQGAGAKTVIRDPAPTGSGLPPELSIADDRFVTVKNVTLDGNYAGAGVTVGHATLTLIGSTVTRSGAAPAIHIQPGTGTADLTVLRSTIANNNAAGASGIVVTTATAPGARATVNVIDSTLTGNQGAASGGAIQFSVPGALNVRDSTIAGNGGGVWIAAEGTLTPTFTLTDSILANNAGSDCADTAGITDGGHNLLGVSDSGCPGITNGVNGDLAGTDTNPLDPGLGALASNGGPTQTMALQSGSPAIGAGDPTDCTAAPVNDTDQRGVSRNATARGACDIGAYDTGGVAS